MPKTQVKAIGSLAERIATRDPSPTPPARVSDASSAAAISAESPTTSAYDIDVPSVLRHGRSGPRLAPLSR